MAELWGTVVVSLLFWGLANHVCSVEEAKKFYTILGTFGNVALVVSGYVSTNSKFVHIVHGPANSFDFAYLCVR